jgi:DUF305 family protein family protein
MPTSAMLPANSAMVRYMTAVDVGARRLFPFGGLQTSLILEPALRNFFRHRASPRCIDKRGRMINSILPRYLITTALGAALSLAAVFVRESPFHSHRDAPPMSEGNPAATQMNDAMARMHRDMAMPSSGDSDRDFAAMMIPHHQGAVDMARIELQSGKDPVLRRLAQGIIVEQLQEIDVMRRQLKDSAAICSSQPGISQ